MKFNFASDVLKLSLLSSTSFMSYQLVSWVTSREHNRDMVTSYERCFFEHLWVSLFPYNDFSVWRKRTKYSQSLLILLKVVLKMKDGVGLTLKSGTYKSEHWPRTATAVRAACMTLAGANEWCVISVYFLWQLPEAEIIQRLFVSVTPLW